MNVSRDTLELRFQVRPSTFYQRCRDQQFYIQQLLTNQWHNESEIKQLKERLKYELAKNKLHQSTANGNNNGSSITEINPLTSAATSTITVGDNCQLISVNLASGASSGASTSYSSSGSENADLPADPTYPGTKPKHSLPSDPKYCKKRPEPHPSMLCASSKNARGLRLEQFHENRDEAAQTIYTNTHSTVDAHATAQNDGTSAHGERGAPFVQSALE